jgi:hypothetical protein
MLPQTFLKIEDLVRITNELAAFFPGRLRACARKVRYDRIEELRDRGIKGLRDLGI